MGRTFCIGCGAPMESDSAQAVPLCPACTLSPKEGGIEILWTVRRAGKRAEGPFKRSIIEDWIAKGILDPSDEVARVEGAWASIEIHQDFRAFFTPGDAAYTRRLEAISERRRRFAIEATRERVRGFALLSVMVAFIVLPLATWQFRIGILPEQASDKIFGAIGHVWGGFFTKMEHAANKVEKPRIDLANLPGEEIVQRLDAGLTEEERGGLLYLRGKTASLDESPERHAAAVRDLESALVAAPSDVRVIGALVGVYLDDQASVPGHGQDALTLLSRGDAIATDSPAILEAHCRAALAVSSPGPASEAADACLRVDPANLECRFCRGQAMSLQERSVDALAELRGVVKSAPAVPRFQLGVASAALEREAYADARQSLEAFLAEHPGSTRGREIAARFAWFTADWSRALREARRVLDLDPDNLDMALLGGQMALVLEGPGSALPLADRLVGLPGFKGYARAKEGWLLQAQALRGSGRAKESAAAAGRALSISEDWAPASLALAQAELAANEDKSAEEAIRRAIFSDLPAVDTARFHEGIAQVYVKLGRDKAAIASFESALEAWPGSFGSRVGLAEIYLRMGSIDKAVTVLRASASTDFEQTTTHPPYSICQIGAPPLEEVGRAFASAAEKNIRDKRDLATIEGILAFHQGDRARAESRLRQALRDDDGDDDARAYLGRILLERGDLVEAASIWKRLAATNGKEGLYAVFEGLALARLGQQAEAQAAFEQGFQSTQELPGVHRRRAFAYFLAGRRDEALSQAMETLRLDPLDHQVRKIMLERDEAETTANREK
jgi:tetratricopeptide (TPR) repeat protein